MFAGLMVMRGDVTPDAMNWANASGTSPVANADQTLAGISAGITLRATLSAGSYDSGAKSFIVYKNGSSFANTTPADGAYVDVTVVNGDTVHYEATKGTIGSGTNWNATVTVTQVETGATIDTFTLSADAAP